MPKIYSHLTLDHMDALLHVYLPCIHTLHVFRIHAADVLRNLYVIMQRGGVLSSAFPENMELSLLASFFAAIGHDYDHRGLNNDFLVKTSDPLAVIYHSPLMLVL